jgi:hypothetical protein
MGNMPFSKVTNLADAFLIILSLLIMRKEREILQNRTLQAGQQF